MRLTVGSRSLDSHHGLWPWARSGFRPTGGQEGTTGSARGAPFSSAIFQTAFGLLSLVSCLLSNGCLSRSLTIRTDPPGALVYMNDQLKGTSPVSYDFLWYGWHRVTIRKEGFERIEDRKEIRAPIYLWMPFDLAIEVLPIPVHDTRTFSYALTPMQMPPTPVPPLTDAGATRPMEATDDAR